jgi:soluble lytic murein transglycosylase-like protein
MQLMPQTASVLGVNDCFHPEDNIVGGIRHLSYLIDLYDADLKLALAAYNAGENAVARYRGIPPYAETRAYVRRVLDNYERYRHEPIVVKATVKTRQ